MLHKSSENRLDAAFIELSSVDSTNNYALSAIRRELASHGTAFFAEEQTAGKGQMGRKWQSEKGNNIALSVVLQPRKQSLNSPFFLNACVAIAVQQFFTRFTGGELFIKWPNDLYWKNRKLAGILVESIIAGGLNGPEWKWAVAGVGVNINQSVFSQDLPNPVSLKQITGKYFNCVGLAKELHPVILDFFNELETGATKKFANLYNDCLYKRDELVNLKKDSRVFQTYIKGVNDFGELVTEINGIEETFRFGEIKWQI